MPRYRRLEDAKAAESQQAEAREQNTPGPQPLRQQLSANEIAAGAREDGESSQHASDLCADGEPVGQQEWEEAENGEKDAENAAKRPPGSTGHRPR